MLISCYYSYGQFDDPFQMTLCAPWYMHSSQVALTTVTLCCTASQQKSLVGCRQYYPLPLD